MPRAPGRSPAGPKESTAFSEACAGIRRGSQTGITRESAGICGNRRESAKWVGEGGMDGRHVRKSEYTSKHFLFLAVKNSLSKTGFPNSVFLKCNVCNCRQLNLLRAFAGKAHGNGPKMFRQPRKPSPGVPTTSTVSSACVESAHAPGRPAAGRAASRRAGGPQPTGQRQRAVQPARPTDRATTWKIDSFSAQKAFTFLACKVCKRVQLSSI
jgi:hypothetical protein